jgi:hypothetical protein
LWLELFLLLRSLEFDLDLCLNLKHNSLLMLIIIKFYINFLLQLTYL